MGYFGSAYKIFLVFLLMATRNIKSIEQLKNANLKEAGLILGLNKLPSKGRSAMVLALRVLLRSMPFRWSHFSSSSFDADWSVSITACYDGHLLPYTATEGSSLAFNTQRKMMKDNTIIPLRLNQYPP
ncbi:MAG: hypothetical protein SRB2_02930 [Desulfobacteraceae bacterium Eth-SRB2]|nr:MAG: hypothetical protein SRB2_02930 [Desulfobacteraceae bacterium Eth-SRB2]